MSERWLEISIPAPDAAVELVSQLLTELGCTGVTAAERELDTFTVPSPESLHSDPEVRAYFPYPDDPEVLCQQVQQQLATMSGLYPELARLSLHYRELAAKDWASDWKQHFTSFRVGQRLVIHPSWIDYQSAEGEVTLTLDPGQAFGTGTHATTSLCLDAMAELFDADKPVQTILDVGTGSGILAMAGAALGAKTVLGCDIDAVACRVAGENVQRNHLTESIDITEAPLEQIDGCFDLVLANILASENIRLATPLVEHLRPGGSLILSGILIEQEQQVLEIFSAYPLSLSATHHRDEWTAIVYRRHE
ncbi:MAG: 50S ribosomal protein L11 methyltransferase [Desulfuromonadales bacterium]|nr:50S ribosomal protein L11 methyltransferase [Desulfuromonadales bacterium]